MINFFIYYGLGVLRFVNFIFWLIFALKYKHSKINKFIVQGFIIILGIFILWDILMIISNRSGEVYLFFWTIVTITEFYIFIYSFLKIIRFNLDNYFFLIIILVAIPIILTAILSFFYKTYEILNKVDFVSILILAILVIINMRFILLTKKFEEYLESFFIFTGFILYFGLHLLASNSMMFNFLGSWHIAQNATLISLLFWLGSVFLIWKIRYRHR